MKIILKKKKKINNTINEKIINLENEKTQIENISKILDDDINQKNKKTIARLSKKIDSYAFMNCSSLQAVVIPKKITEFGFNIFEGCFSIKEIHISIENPNEIIIAKKRISPFLNG